MDGGWTGSHAKCQQSGRCAAWQFGKLDAVSYMCVMRTSQTNTQKRSQDTSSARCLFVLDMCPFVSAGQGQMLCGSHAQASEVLAPSILFNLFNLCSPPPCSPPYSSPQKQIKQSGPKKQSLLSSGSTSSARASSGSQRFCRQMLELQISSEQSAGSSEFSVSLTCFGSYMRGFRGMCES